jgi:hypothetical protein
MEEYCSSEGDNLILTEACLSKRQWAGSASKRRNSPKLYFVIAQL